jgi:hypothetical protein
LNEAAGNVRVPWEERDTPPEVVLELFEERITVPLVSSTVTSAKFMSGSLVTLRVFKMVTEAVAVTEAWENPVAEMQIVRRKRIVFIFFIYGYRFMNQKRTLLKLELKKFN